MKINCVKLNYKPLNFKSNSVNNENSFGYDDEISKARREYIREDIFTRTFANQDIVENEPRLEEFELNKLITSLLGAKKTEDTAYVQKVEPNKINPDLMRQLNACNVKPIYGSASYRGGVSSLRESDLKTLKEAGIKTIIPLVPTRFDKETCEEFGLNYFYFNGSPEMFFNDAFRTKEQVRSKEIREAEMFHYKPNVEGVIKTWSKNKTRFVDNFVKFIQLMQQDNVYVGCEFGTHSTDDLLMLNHFLNPKAQETSSYIGRFSKSYVQFLPALIQNLTPENKEAIGWTPEFEEKTLSEINAILDR